MWEQIECAVGYSQRMAVVWRMAIIWSLVHVEGIHEISSMNDVRLLVVGETATQRQEELVKV